MSFSQLGVGRKSVIASAHLVPFLLHEYMSSLL